MEITIQDTEYKMLVRRDEEMNVIARIMIDAGYISDSTLRSIIGLPQKEVENK